ncbi:MAG: hypothetical protein NTY19_26400 [Planctomycetota bacterium]|nr:hypothetical protein [Planctomycetota bacterium]
MTSTLLAADAKLRIEPRETWSAVFGDSEMTFNFELSSTEPFDGQVGWVLSAKNRTILRGEAPAAILPDKPATVTVPLRIPPVKEGLVFGTELTLSVHEKGGRKPVVSLVKPLWIYARDPFVDRSQWLKDLKLMLYDPAGKTAAVFDQAHVPFRELRNTAAIAELQEGLLVIGEDVSLDDHRDVAEAVCQLAANGVPVLCLAAADGAFELPGGGEVTRSGADADQDERLLPRGSGRPQSLTFRRADVLADLDHRLDAQGWPPDGKLVAHGLALASEHGRVVAQVTESADGWAWLQMRYPPPGATLVVCQFTIIQRWDAGPTPRFLLARLLEYLDEGRRMTDDG